MSGTSETSRRSTHDARPAGPNSESTSTQRPKDDAANGLRVSVAARSEAHIGRVVADPERTITPRQLELLALYASGYGYEDIGSMKFLSPHTVKWHLANALQRSHARNLTHLCVILIEAGMIARSGDSYAPVPDLRVAGD